MKYKLSKIVRSHSSLITSMDTYEELLATSSEDTTIKIFNNLKLNLLITYTYHRMRVNQVKFSKSVLYSCGDDYRIKSVDLNSNKVVNDYFGHSKSVTSIDVNDTLISGSADKTIRVWDLRVGKEVKKLVGHKDTITKVDNKERIISSSIDGCIKVWDKRQYNTVYFESSIKTFDTNVFEMYLVLNNKVVVVDKDLKYKKEHCFPNVRSVLLEEEVSYLGGSSLLKIQNKDSIFNIACRGMIECITANNTRIFCGGDDKTVQVIEKIS